MIEARTLRDTIVLTPAGRAKLEEELRALREQRLPWVVARLAELHEDAIIPGEDLVLPTLLDEYARAQRRLLELEWLLATAVEATPATDGVAALGSSVTVEEDEERETLQLVCPCEADAIERRITVDSPVGRQLLGRRVGDVVTVPTPRGERRLRIVALA